MEPKSNTHCIASLNLYSTWSNQHKAIQYQMEMVGETLLPITASQNWRIDMETVRTYAHTHIDSSSYWLFYLPLSDQIAYIQ